jgi:LacI family transcriptional regulator
MAAATMAVAHRKGMDVPRDLAIAGFDDTPLASMIWPELTTVRRPISDMAREAVRLLLEQIRAKRGGKTHATEHKLLGFTLVKRQSTSPATPRRKKP